jgi:hypothetical protein
MGMRAEYINRTGQKSPVAISNALPERVANLIDTVKRSWEAATEGVEKPVSYFIDKIFSDFNLQNIVKKWWARKL